MSAPNDTATRAASLALTAGLLLWATLIRAEQATRNVRRAVRRALCISGERY